MSKPRLGVFGSGSETGGGSGLQWLAMNIQTGKLDAEPVVAVSHHEHGGVRKHADAFGIPFAHMQKPFSAEAYQAVVKKYGIEWISLSGWLKLVRGLPPERTINIHPGRLPDFGGKGMHGHHVHEAVLDAFQRGEISESAVTMHFVTDEYDRGPIFFEYPVKLLPGDTADDIGARVNRVEHGWQSYITNLVIHGEIALENGNVRVPTWYTHLPKNHVPEGSR